MADEPMSEPEMSLPEWEELIRQAREARRSPHGPVAVDGTPPPDPWTEAALEKEAICDAASMLRVAVKAAAHQYGPMQPLYQRIARLSTADMLVELARDICPEVVRFMAGDPGPGPAGG